MGYTLELAVVDVYYTTLDKDVLKNSKDEGYVQIFKDICFTGKREFVTTEPFDGYEEFRGTINEFFKSFLPTYPIIVDGFAIHYLIKENGHYVIAYIDPHKITVAYIDNHHEFDYVEATSRFGAITPDEIRETVRDNIPVEIENFKALGIKGICNAPEF